MTTVGSRWPHAGMPSAVLYIWASFAPVTAQASANDLRPRDRPVTVFQRQQNGGIPGGAHRDTMNYEGWIALAIGTRRGTRQGVMSKTRGCPAAGRFQAPKGSDHSAIVVDL